MPDENVNITVSLKTIRITAVCWRGEGSDGVPVQVQLGAGGLPDALREGLIEVIAQEARNAK